jgi:transposase
VNHYPPASRDSRPDCLQVVIALIVTPDGFPLAYEVMNGNTSEHKTLSPVSIHIDWRTTPRTENVSHLCSAYSIGGFR